MLQTTHYALAGLLALALGARAVPTDAPGTLECEALFVVTEIEDPATCVDLDVTFGNEYSGEYAGDCEPILDCGGDVFVDWDASECSEHELFTWVIVAMDDCGRHRNMSGRDTNDGGNYSFHLSGPCGGHYEVRLSFVDSSKTEGASVDLLCNCL